MCLIKLHISILLIVNFCGLGGVLVISTTVLTNFAYFTVVLYSS